MLRPSVFSQDAAEAWCIDLMGKETSPNAELLCLFSLAKTQRLTRISYDRNLKPYRLNKC